MQRHGFVHLSPRWVMAAPIVATAACANIWGFADLKQAEDAGEADGASDALPAVDHGFGDDGAGHFVDVIEASAVDVFPDALDGGVPEAACNLTSGMSCKGKCGSGNTCGCLPNNVTHTVYCGDAGSKAQGANCASDSECSPGLGCYSVTHACEHWCRPTTTCPSNTQCSYPDAAAVYNGESFGRCL